MIVSMIDIYQDIATRDKLIFLLVITRILRHMHVPIPPTPHFSIMGAITQDSLRRSIAQLTSKAKRPREESTLAQPEEANIRVAENATYASRPPTPPSSAPSFSSKVNASLIAILDKLQHMRANFGSCLDHISNEMCQMNTKIGRIAHRQSHLGGFVPSPSPNPSVESSNNEDYDSDDSSSTTHDDDMTVSQ